jgi:hypothetical protein
MHKNMRYVICTIILMCSTIILMSGRIYVNS